MTRINPEDARYLAQQVLRVIDRYGKRVWLRIEANGEAYAAVGDFEPQDGSSLVGVYTADATATEITDDILEMEREAMA